MNTKKLLLFAPVTFDLAETTRMIEIAKGIINRPLAKQGIYYKLHMSQFKKQEEVKESVFAAKVNSGSLWMLNWE